MRFRDAYDPFRALGGAFKLVKVAPITILTGAFLLTVCHPSVVSNFYQDEIDDSVAAALGCTVCVIALVLLALYSLFFAGFATAVERVAVTGEEKIGDLFAARGRFWSVVLVHILVVVVSVLCLAPFLLFAGGAAAIGAAMGGDEAAVAFGILAFLVSLPGYIYLVLGIALAPEAVAIERKMPVEALTHSWTLVRGNRLWLFWFLLVQSVFVALGICLCCVGVFATSMLSSVASFEAYLRLIRDDQASWSIEGGAGAPMHSISPDDPDDSDW